jgi:hypothetical protein
VTVVSVQAVTKASDTHVPLPISLLYALVYSLLVVCMIGGIFKEKELLC